MSTDVPFTPPKKKPNVLWWIAGLFLLLLLWFFFQLFGPSPPIIVSPSTTYITEPLSKGGLPDYEQYVLEMYRKGVTPENNAAVLIWPALWPGVSQQDSICCAFTTWRSRPTLQQLSM